MHRFKFTLLLLPWLLALSTSAEINVTAIFNPPRIALGDKAQYVLEIKETSTSEQPEIERVTSLPIPQSGGLDLTNGRTATSQQTSIINGAREYSVIAVPASYSSACACSRSSRSLQPSLVRRLVG